MPLDLLTIHVLVGLTFLLLALVIAFHARLIRQFGGIWMFFASTLVLSAGSLVLVLHGRFTPETLGILDSAAMVAGAGLQYAAVSRFLGHRPDAVFIGGWALAAALVIGLVGWGGQPHPGSSLREILPTPFFLAAAVRILRTDTRGFRAGAVLAALSLGFYSVRSLFRFGWVLTTPDVQGPGPPALLALDEVSFFAFSLLWTSGFLLMVNQRLHEGLVLLATRDPLTSCLNRRAVAERLADEQLRFRRYGREYSVILIDLDRFKSINDTFGHQLGDQVLVRLAEVLRGALRAGDHVARWGGEEFLILLPETPADEALVLADRLRLLVEAQDFSVPGRTVTFSAGVAGSRPDQNIDELCARADQALYRAKETRNTVVPAP